jgi:hypothetical protein
MHMVLGPSLGETRMGFEALLLSSCGFFLMMIQYSSLSDLFAVGLYPSRRLSDECSVRGGCQTHSDTYVLSIASLTPLSCVCPLLFRLNHTVLIFISPIVISLHRRRIALLRARQWEKDLPASGRLT